MDRNRLRAQRGNFGTANFMLDLAQQLKEMLAAQEELGDEEKAYSIYMQVIEELLNCPNGAETEILRSHQDIIDTRFILTMQQIAAMFNDISEKKLLNFCKQ